MPAQFNRVALEGAVNLLRETDEEMMVDYVEWMVWNCGSRAEATIRIRQALNAMARAVVLAENRGDTVQAVIGQKTPKMKLVKKEICDEPPVL